MTTPTAPRRASVASVLGVLALVYAVTFAIGSLLHRGVRIPLGFALLTEPRILPATIVEGICALALAVAAYSLLARRPWAWAAAVAGHAVALAGVMLGIAATAAPGRGPSTELNTIYHRVMLVALAASLLALMTPAVRAALRRALPR
jgi:hypothetical protein